MTETTRLYALGCSVTNVRETEDSTFLCDLAIKAIDSLKGAGAYKQEVNIEGLQCTAVFYKAHPDSKFSKEQVLESTVMDASMDLSDGYLFCGTGVSKSDWVLILEKGDYSIMITPQPTEGDSFWYPQKETVDTPYEGVAGTFEGPNAPFRCFNTEENPLVLVDKTK